MQTGEIDFKGRKLFYRTTGEGPLVVLLHGFGEDSTIWKRQYNIFSNHRLLIPDLPGSGRSEAIDDMSIEGLAEAVKVIMEALTPPKEEVAEAEVRLEQDTDNNTPSLQGQDLQTGQSRLWGQAVMIGHSMGGYITLAFAEKYPEALRAFGLFNSTAFADSEEKKDTRRKGIRFMEQHGAASFLKTATPNLYAPLAMELHPEWLEEHLSLVHNFSAENLVSYYMAMIQRPDRTTILKQSTMPVLFVMGQHDAAVPLQDGLKQCYLPQLSYIHILEHSGHMGMIEEQESANQILSQFVVTTETTV